MTKTRLLLADGLPADSRRPPFPINGGFVPDFYKSQSFVIKDIGGFVFQKSSQHPAFNFQRPKMASLLSADADG